jgi:hypothetical protein
MSSISIKTSELEGTALNWAVALLEKRKIISQIGGGILVQGRTEEGEELPGFNFMWTPSTDWTQAGRIIHREGIALRSNSRDNTLWEASFSYVKPGANRLPLEYFTMKGETPLVAAMRTYVASACGREVIVPEPYATLVPNRDETNN